MDSSSYDGIIFSARIFDLETLSTGKAAVSPLTIDLPINHPHCKNE